MFFNYFICSLIVLLLLTFVLFAKIVVTDHQTWLNERGEKRGGKIKKKTTRGILLSRDI